jgi:plasmid stabilization system protein ParE
LKRAYRVTLHPQASEDLLRLHEFLADYDLDVASRALETIEAAVQAMSLHPYICRRVQREGFPPEWRELIISFGNSGYLVLFEITSDYEVTVMAVKHQRESDYH